MDLRLLRIVVAGLLLIPVSGFAEIITLRASIDAAQANRGIGTSSGGTGSALMTLDTETNLFNWDVRWQNLEAPTNRNHFHGPGAPGNNGPVQINFGPISGLISPSIGSSTISDSQAADLLNNLWYINFHTDAFPGGELRGQIFRDPDIVSPFVLRDGRWESLVIPGNPEGRTIASLFGDYLPVAEYAATWIIFTFDPETQVYESPDLGSVPEQGRAFWMIQETGVDVTIGVLNDLPTGDAEPSLACASVSGCLSLPLPTDPDSARYDLVGSPYNTMTSLADVRFKTNIGVDNCTNGCDLSQANDEQFSIDGVFAYDSEINDYRRENLESLIEPWQGYWVVARPAADGRSPELLVPLTQDP